MAAETGLSRTGTKAHHRAVPGTYPPALPLGG